MSKIPLLKKLKISIFQLILGISVAVCLILCVPQVVSMGKVSKEVAEKRKILKDLDSGIKNFELLQKNEASLSWAYNDFLNSLPPQKEFPVFLEIISNMARKNNVKIIAIEPQKVLDTGGNFFTKVPVFVDAYCGYHDLGKFLNDIEHADKFMRVVDIKISKDEPDSDVLQVFLSIGAYCLNEVNGV